MTDLDWLFERQRFGIKGGLARVRELLNRLENPQGSFQTILVAGTNGKGSTAATLAGILNEAGQRTGLFTSPHLSYFGERFVVAGRRLASEEVAAAVARVRPHAETAGATFFEIVTALAVLLFAEQEVRYAVMECGMGGRNDATNVLEPVLSLITNVSLDHTSILGNSVEEIAEDKAGIMRADKPCLSTARSTAWNVLTEHARSVGADLEQIVPVAVAPKGWRGVEVELELANQSFVVASPLIGTFQGNNVALAAAAARRLGATKKAISAGAAQTRWPGRLERLSYKNRTVVLDGAHNPAAATALAETLKTLNFDKLLLVFGANQGKDVAAVLRRLEPLAQHLFLTRAGLSPKAVSPQTLSGFATGETFEQPQAALEAATAKAAKNDLVLVAGSLYLVGELRPYLLGKRGEGLERWQ